MKDNGGPAFPVIHTIVTQPGSFTQAPLGHEGMTLRDFYVSAAPAEEITDIVPQTAADAAKWLGVELYDYRVHYPMALAKARGIWADAMIAARKEEA